MKKLMQIVLPLLLVGMTTSCKPILDAFDSEEDVTTVRESGEDVTQSESFTESNAFTAGGFGPTGNPDPVNPNEIPGRVIPQLINYPSANTGNLLNNPTGSNYEKCGVLYKTINNDFAKFLENGKSKAYAIEGNNRQAQLDIEGLTFPQDSREACIEGELFAQSNESEHDGRIEASLITFDDPIAHPERPSGFDYEYCGDFEFFTCSNNSVAVMATIVDHPYSNSLPVIISNGFDKELPFLSEKDSVNFNGFNFKGCLYRNQKTSDLDISTYDENDGMHLSPLNGHNTAFDHFEADVLHFGRTPIQLQGPSVNPIFNHISGSFIDQETHPDCLEDGFKLCYIGNAGTGEHNQSVIAKALEHEECDQVRVIGKMSEDGINFSKSINAWEKFERPFKRVYESPKGTEFFLTMGSQAYQRRPDAWVEYADGSPNTDDHPKMNMPSRFYAERYGPICIFNLDTHLYNEPETYPTARDNQTTWFQDTVAAQSTCEFSIALGQHAYFNSGPSGDLGDGELKSFLDDNVVGHLDVYLSAQDFIMSDEGRESQTTLLTSGAALKFDPRSKNPKEFAAEDVGFITMTFKRNNNGKIRAKYKFVAVYEDIRTADRTMEQVGPVYREIIHQKSVVGSGLR